ncbi:MAG: chloride channel protein, partial [Bacteroidota bacterium]|nr:chloride channel protein [Bacteroidota bacterium]
MRATLKNWFDKIKNQKLKENLLQAFPFWLASVVAGLTAVLYTKLFVWMEGISRAFIQQHKWWFFLLAPLAFSGAYFVVKKWASYARGSGIPQIMAALEMPSGTSTATFNKFIGVRIILVKVCSSLLMVLGGGAIGREGPTIQISASVFRKINQWIPKS